MPKARKKMNSEFEPSPVKSVFLFGKPNKGKLDLLWQMEHKYVELINFNIEALMVFQIFMYNLSRTIRRILTFASFKNSYGQKTSILHSVRMHLMRLLQNCQTGWMQYVWKCSRQLIPSSASPRCCLACALMVWPKMK